MKIQISELKKLIGANKRVSDYKINSTETTSDELFFVHRKLETM